VVLVREESTTARLFRLKRWRTPAAPGFLEDFERLKTQL
jgi:hypothetical protein